MGTMLLIFLRLSGTDAQANTDEKNIRSAAGMMLFVSERNDKTGWLDTGRVYERVALTAAALSIKTAFMNQPAEVPALRSQLQSYLNLGRSSSQLLLRFGDSEPMPRSLRRPVNEDLA
jgi:hypothetical protein